MAAGTTVRPGRTQSCSGLLSPGTSQRLAFVDAGRGIAVVLMVAYHFCFDLNYFGLVRLDLYGGNFWLVSRGLIVTLFLLVMGASLHLSSAVRFSTRAFFRRVVLIGGSAIAVSVGSYLLFPRSWIYFGVLHFIAAASVLALPFLRVGRANLWLGIGFIAAGLMLQSNFFDHPWVNWIGFTTRKPITEDYVPLFPWFGVVLLGLFLGPSLAVARPFARLRAWRPVHHLGLALSWLGRHSLSTYLLHQPILLGLIYLATGGAR